MPDLGHGPQCDLSRILELELFDDFRLIPGPDIDLPDLGFHDLYRNVIAALPSHTKVQDLPGVTIDLVELIENIQAPINHRGRSFCGYMTNDPSLDFLSGL